MKKILTIFFTILLLAGCANDEAKEFIEQASTEAAVKEMVMDSMEQEGLTVSIQQIDYEHIGKQIDPSVIVVDYKTLHEPTYAGRAYIDVDVTATPRKLIGVDRLGLDDQYGILPIGTVLIERLKQAAHQSMIPIIEAVSSKEPGLSWEEDEEKIGFNGVDYKKEKLHELLKLYGEDKLASPSEKQAKQWLEQFEQPTEDPQEPVIWLYLQYDGEMTNSQFEKIVLQFKNNEALPQGNYTVRIISERYNDTEDPVYNKRSNGKGSNVFIASYNTF